MSKRTLLVPAVLFCAYAYFYQAGGWNQNSRFDLVRALVETDSTCIDAYAANTGDVARHDGHAYSDKAPGLALAAVPVVALARPVLRAARVDPTSSAGIAWLSYLATLWTAGLPTALAALALTWIARRLGAKEGGAAFAALAWGLSTPMWAYATLFWGHALASACLVFGLAAAVALGEVKSARRDVVLGTALGLAVGWAVVSDFSAAPPAAILAGTGLAFAHRGGRRRTLRMAAGIAAGAGTCIVVLAAYQKASFGSIFSPGYAHVEGWSGMKVGFMGITYPHPVALAEILIGPFRGLLPLAPVVAAGPVGLYLVRRQTYAPAIFAALAIAAYYILFNASYWYWNGGWSYGPRHLAAALPCLCLGLGPLWSQSKLALRALLVALVLWGAGCSLVAVSTTAQPPERIEHPMTTMLWPAFRAGDLSLNHQSFLDAGADEGHLRGGAIPHDAFNLGEKLGLRGLWSLVPLAAVLSAFACAWWLTGTKAAPRRA